MFRYLLFVFLFITSCQPAAQLENDDTETPARKDSLDYDAALATQLGADDYGMKQYVMAFLKAGPNQSQDSIEAARLQRAHLDNITRMAEAGKLIVAGPFMDNGEIRGIYVFNVSTLEEARLLTASDPAIKAGILEMELRPWYSSAALIQVNEIHEKVAKKGI